MSKESTSSLPRGPEDAQEVPHEDVAAEEERGKGLEMGRLVLDLGLNLVLVLVLDSDARKEGEPKPRRASNIPIYPRGAPS